MPILASFRPYLRDLRMAAVALLAASGAALDAQVSSAADGFSPNPNGVVNAIVVQPDGRILVGGFFTQFQPSAGVVAPNPYLARLNHDGSVDGSVNPNLNGAVNAIALASNGQIIAGGAFTTANNGAFGCNHLVRLNADGSLDTTFNPNANGSVYAIAVQSNGQIVIGGAFTSLQPNGAPSPTTRRHIARLNADGSLDMSYDPEANAAVLALTFQPNGQLLVGGGFATFQPNGASSPSTYNCMARINSDGSLDATFNPNANGAISSIVVQTNGQILIAGGFTSVTPLPENGNTTQVDYFARLNADSSLDHSFIVNPLAYVSAVALQADGRMLIGGTFTSVYPVNATTQSSASFVARINTDGSLDTSFNPTPNQAINAIAVQADGEILLGGYFSQLEPNGAVAGTARSCLARVGQDGSLDATLAPDTLGHVVTAAVQANGQILIGGTFTSVGGVTRNYMARLNSDGSLDTSFNPTIDGKVSAVVVQSNGQIVIGGSFANVDGIPRSFIARLNADGSVDGPYNPNANGLVDALALQSNGQILVGGAFTMFQPNGAATSTTRSYIARLNTDGTLDTFDPEANGQVFAITMQSNGQIIIGGSFTVVTPPGSIEENGRNYIARLNNDGTLDKDSFNPNANGTVYAIAIQSNGQVIIGGNFTELEPATDNTNTTATVPTTRNSIARLNSDGTLDMNYDPNASSSILSLALLANGQVMAGGNFTSFEPNGATSGTLRNYIARINTDATIDSTFTTSTNAQVSLITLLANGQMLVAGAFTGIQPSGGAVVSADHVAILNADGSISGTFAIGAGSAGSGQVNAAAIQPNGQLLVGGAFANIGGSTSTNLARFNSDGTTDTSFNPNADGAVNSVVVLPNGAATASATSFGAWLNSNGTLRYALSSGANGQISTEVQLPNGQLLVGGLFANLQNVGVSNIARINANGSVDPTFNPSPNGQVRAIVVQSNGQIVISGDFTQIGSATMNYIARINTDGTLDATYNPDADAEVAAMAIQSDGRVIVAGSFGTLQPNGAATTTGRGNIARLNTDGSVDSTFNPNPNSSVATVVLMSNGQVLIGGSFTSIQPNATGAATARYYIARLNTDGSVDANFNPNPNGLVSAIAVQSNGQLVVGGGFTTLQPNGTGDNLTGVFLIRLNSDGTLDTTYSPTPNGTVSALALQANGQIIAGGSFTGFSPSSTPAGTPAGTTTTTTAYTPGSNGAASITRDYIARLNTDGSIDLGFDPETNAPVTDVDVLADGSIFIGGTFTTVQAGGAFLVAGAFVNIGSALSPYLARLNFDGSADTSFTTTTNGTVNALSVQPNGQVLVAGSFTSIGGQFEFNLARLNADGSLDMSFNPNANATVNAAAVSPSGLIVAGGAFTSMGGQPASYVARLTASGAVDASFVAAPNGAVTAVVVQPNGQTVIGGAFTSVSGVARTYLARLNANGSVDTTFNPAPNGPVAALTLQADGTLMVGGSFTSIAGQVISYVVRLTSTGSVVTDFSPGANGPVDAIAVQPDAKVVLGGSFTSVGGLPRYQFARISAPSAATQSITISPDDSTLTWNRGGGSPELVSVEFEESPDSIIWTTVGQATRVGSTSSWQLGGIPSNGNTNFYARARGVAATSQFGSASLIETVQSFFVIGIPVITSGAQLTASVGTPFTYQIGANNSPTAYGATGLPAGLAVNSTTGLISGTPSQSGSFTVTVTASNSGGPGTGTILINVSPAGGTGFTSVANSLSNRLINVSTRAVLSGSQSQVLGFVISGTGSKSVLLRAVGPGLAAFGVANPVADPQLQLYSISGTLLAQNAGWGGSSTLSAAFAQVGAFGLAANSADSAILTTLAPGSYTIKVADLAGIGGTVLSEVYDASPSPLTATQRLANLSSLGTVSPGSGTLVAGFVIAGNSAKSVLIRGLGPTLATFGVTGVLPDPVLNVYNSAGALVAQNYFWGSQIVASSLQPAISPGDITAESASVGASALLAGSNDTALIGNLPPGAYTAQVWSASGSTGQALVEVYELH